jgi:hypothetical protein
VTAVKVFPEVPHPLVRAPDGAVSCSRPDSGRKHAENVPHSWPTRAGVGPSFRAFLPRSDPPPRCGS